MGIASRTKWERRLPRHPSKLKFIHPVKLEVHRELAQQRHGDRAWATMLHDNASRRHSEACDAAKDRAKRRRSARMHRGWLPRSQRS